MNVDVGRTVRQWKLQFTGEKGSSIEQFIERVNECRSVARIADEDLINPMSELTSGVEGIGVAKLAKIGEREGRKRHARDE